ncbi:hypothetical protein LXL04_033245 [Taraxacum kok-saghyz]
MHHHLLQLLRLCANRRLTSHGKSLHARILNLGLDSYGALPNTLISMYGKCGLINDAVQLFDEMPQRDLVSWASILTAYNQSNLPNRALSLFPLMSTRDCLQPDHFVFATLVNSCAAMNALQIGNQLHAQIILSPFSSDDVVKSSLVDMYAKCGSVDAARAVFETISSKNPISWTAMISGYARSGRKSDAIDLLRDMKESNLFSWTALISGLIQSGHIVSAFHLFIEMRKEGIKITDPFILSTIIVASANLSALELGKQVHSLVLKLGFQSSLYISNSLIDMYAKCSDIIAAKTTFHSTLTKDVVSWTSMIVGLAQHGKAKEALSLYDDMLSTGLKPNEVTFIGLIYACSHVGLVSKGRDLFKSMVNRYKLNPNLHHYTCLLDLYSRSGHLNDAENLLNTMPFEIDEAVWASLLSSCKRFGNTQMGIRVADRLLELGVKDPSTFILLSNFYAGGLMWEKVAKVRKLMASMDLKKQPGYSYVNLGTKSEVFYAGEMCHVMKDEIFVLLKDLDEEMRRRGYAPDVSFVLHDWGVKEKEKQLFWHSERLAVAYGLINGVKGSVIRVVKNLRVCGDCHTVLKFVSGIVGREIVVRDASRFHHFKYGKCSCLDFCPSIGDASGFTLVEVSYSRLPEGFFPEDLGGGGKGVGKRGDCGLTRSNVLDRYVRRSPKMEANQAASGGGSGGVGGGPAPFLLKTYDMVDDSMTDEIVSWSTNRNSFVVWNPPEFARLLLPTYFKHNNFSSFIRQLNTYGFRKIDPERWEFANEEFVKDQKHLLKNIHRRKPIHSHSTNPQASAIDPERAAFEEEIDKLTREKASLEKNISRFKQQQPASKLQLEDLTHRVNTIEERQDTLLSFLKKAAQNPDFVEHLAQKLESMDLSADNKKRRFFPDDNNNNNNNNNSLPQSPPRPDFGNIFHRDFSNKLRLELSPAVSDINFVSNSTQSSNEDGVTGSPQILLSERTPGGLPFNPEPQELSDSCTSFGFNMESSFINKPNLDSNKETEYPVSCQLNLTLASCVSQIDTCQDTDTIPQSFEEIGKHPPPPAAVPEKAPAAPQARVNDVFWEQFLTERPGSLDVEDTRATSSFENSSNLQNLTL